VPENFGRQAIKDVKSELDDIRRKRGKKIVKPLNPVEEFYRQQGIRPSDLR
jgi:hypothetical protein